MTEFKDQWVVVTGGTRGIGAGISEMFLKEGAYVIATYASSDEKAHAFKNSLNSLNSIESEKLFLKKFDISKKNEVLDFWDQLDQEGRDISVLVNNGGIRQDQLLASMSEENWDLVMDVNLKGTFLMSQQAVLRMMKQRFGRIINMSSIGGLLGLSGQANYSASKAGQIALTKSLSKEVAKRGITVNCILPGFIETELIADLDQSMVDEYKKQVPLKRFGKVEEVAHCVRFLASRGAAYITGTNIEVTGGLG